jgi:hypothetical protein
VISPGSFLGWSSDVQRLAEFALLIVRQSVHKLFENCQQLLSLRSQLRNNGDHKINQNYLRLIAFSSHGQLRPGRLQRVGGVYS